MPIKRVKTGTGITEKETTRVSPPLGAEELDWLRRFWNQDFSFENRYGAVLESQARGVLEKAGLAEPGADLNELASLAVGAERPDSPEGYAVQLLERLQCVRMLIKLANFSAAAERKEYVIRHGDVAEAARFAFELGAIWKEAEMKFRWERLALSGKQRSDDLKAARATYNKRRRAEADKKHAKWREAARKVWAKHPTWGALKVAEVIAKGENPDYIRRIIKTEKPA